MNAGDVSLFLIGGVIGLLGAALGAIWEYRRSLRGDGATGEQLPGLILIVTSGLGAMSIAALILSFLLTRSIRTGLFLGIGVVVGFTAGFIFMFALWLLLAGRQR